MEDPKLPKLDTKGAFSPEVLRPIQDLNTRLLRELVDSTRDAATSAGTAPLSLLLAGIPAEALARLAAVPVCLIDVGFDREGDWTEESLSRELPEDSYFPRIEALHLSQLTFTTAWTTARDSAECAAMIFGMRLSVARSIAALSMQQMQDVSVQRWYVIQPRWRNDLRFWHRLILGAQHNSPRLAPIGVRAMLRVLSDLD